MKTWFKKNGVDLILGIGLTLFLINFFTDQASDLYVISIPLLVYGCIMLYRRHYRRTYKASDFFASSFDDDDDDLYDEAKEAVIEAGKASTSYLQRKLRIGYGRASRLIDLLEERGIISPANGVTPRQVLKAKDE